MAVHTRLAHAGAVLSLGAVLAGPTAYSVATIALAHGGGDPAAGPNGDGIGGGTGIALERNVLYATSGSAIVRYRLASGTLNPIGKPDTIIDGLPMTGSHHSHNFVLQGRTLYVNIGSASNACQQKDRQGASPGYNPCTELDTRAGVWR